MQFSSTFVNSEMEEDKNPYLFDGSLANEHKCSTFDLETQLLPPK